MQKYNLRKIARQCVLSLKSARLKIEQKQSGFLRIIEQYFDDALGNGRFTLSEAFAAGTYLFIFNLLTIETIFVAIIVFVTFVSSGAAGFFAGEHFLLVFIFWVSTLLIIFAVVYVTNTLFLLLHLMRGGQLFAMLLFSALIASLLISYLTPQVSALFFKSSGVRFSQMALPTLAILLITQAFLFVQHKDKLCFQSYCNRMQRAIVNTIIDQKTEGEILVLTAQDHYVEITSTNGKKLVRMRMREAIAQMQDQDGLSVHRSYWVAKDAIQSLQKSEGKHFLLLINGDEIPVSPSKLAGVKEALNL
ncbi:MAG: LytTR family transcriptional regulator DNA-binding domain-containing protein [Rhodobacteraceae bacterium]|nr:LytTR family transcriptional regulator DNA-binding domain-containing protein [Paracoccaceae bacterium]